MLKNSLENLSLIKKLSSLSKEFYKKHKDKIIDIVLFGSAIRGKTSPRDIDIVVIFENFVKKERFDITYDFRKTIEKRDVKADVKGIRFNEIFDASFLARTAIFYEGFSLLKNKFLGELLGFQNYSVFAYSLKTLSHNKKTLFQYALNGRNSPGMIKELNGVHIGSGVVLIPIKKAEQFREFLNSWNVEFNEYRCLFSKVP